MPRFVLLRHETPAGFERPSHWDLMLEAGDHLRCWALPQLPDAPGELWAEALGDHRLAYLEYEGPIAGGRGEVWRADAGEFQFVVDQEDEVTVRLAGERMRGTLALQRGEDGSRWRMSFESAAAGE
jgi:hypothetical protein